MHARVIILDFGSQVTQLIARRVRELNIYCEIYPFDQFGQISFDNVAAVILSGSPASVRDSEHPAIDLDKILGLYPVLGICYGAQLTVFQMGGEVASSGSREFGFAQLADVVDDPVWNDINEPTQIWMSHSDTITRLPDGFVRLGSTSAIRNAAFKIEGLLQPAYFFQFHPEVIHTIDGSKMLGNFLLNICRIKADWTAGSYIDEKVEDIRSKVGDEEVLLALSGGVDSSVAALLLQKAIGTRLHCFFIDNGLLRQGEFEQVLETYMNLGLDVNGIDASAFFYERLKGLEDPEAKRKAIGKAFIDVFEREAGQISGIRWLAQGTIYPDVIESASVHGPSSVIKSHHNVGGLPERLNLKVIEPLRSLFKDEVRKVGKELGLPQHILGRHPFPGPGLAIRIISDVTRDKIEILQKADKIFIDHLIKSGLYDRIWQAGVILLPVKSVGVMGDERTYENVVALRAVQSTDGMTAEWSRIPHDLLAAISTDIINKVKGINRVVYDISSKPPATIEWE